MKKLKYKLSVIICTYNSPDLIKKCINSILKQKILGKMEILAVDGGSDKETIQLLKKYKKKSKNIKIIKNSKKLPEGYGMGKWLGWKKAKGEFILMIDQDNELVGRNCIHELLSPFSDKFICGSLARLKINHEDNFINQYVALQGTDPFFAYRSLDGIINTSRREFDEFGDYFIYNVKKENPIITGGNCFIYRKKLLDDVGGYIQDTQNILNLAKNGFTKIAVPKNAYTHHRAIDGLFSFIKKKKKWGKTYKNSIKNEFSYLPTTASQRKEFLVNLFLICLVFPNIIISAKRIIRSREKAWIMYPILTFITAFIYFIYAFDKKL